MNGAELLKQFREEQSEHAFAELVRRYAGLVFSVARRRLNNATLAEEAAQSVFLRLANAAPNLPSEAALLGWLHRTSVHAAVDLWRAETRRRAREEKAAAMQSIETTENTESALAAEVDEALNELAEPDRLALLLRFFDGRKMRELGDSLGVSEDAAKMRVNRSLERLRERLALRGIQSTPVLLAGFLSEQAVLAAPAALIQSIAATQLAVASQISWASMFMSALKTKYAAALVVAVVSVAIALLSFPSGDASNGNAELQQNQATQSDTASVPAADGAAALAGADKTAPDPRKLLETVARARNRIFSGTMEFETVVEHNERDGVRETNSVRGRIVFDGNKRRFVQVGYEYAYVGVGEAGERNAQIIKEQKMQRADAVRAGLLERFEAAYVTAYDGVARLEYRERDGKESGATISEPQNGLVELFNPRCLGLRAFASSTIENSVSVERAEEVNLVGQEIVDGTSAWHIQLKFPTFSREYWISVAQPERLLKHSELGDVTISRYSSNNPRDVLPIEVTQTTRHYLKRFTRGASEYNIPVDPSFCTLAGLGMPRGTSVVDVRASRSLGYWTGHGLSENLPPKQSEDDSSPSEVRTVRDQVAVLEAEPDTERGFGAATWILLNTPDGPEVEKAGEVILEHHLQSTNLLTIASRLESLRHRCAKPLLKGILAMNPEAEIRGTACFSLAMTLKDEAEFGANKSATAEAKTYFQRVIKDFSTAGKQGPDKARKSTRAIEEIDKVFLGQKAPEVNATTLAGETLSLADFRGNVVLLIFRSGNGYNEAEEHRKILEQFADKRVSFISIICDKLPSKAAGPVEETELDWPAICDGRSGPIAAAYYINGWTSTYLIDQQGVIRQRDLRGEKLAKAIEASITQ